MEDYSQKLEAWYLEEETQRNSNCSIADEFQKYHCCYYYYYYCYCKVNLVAVALEGTNVLIEHVVTIIVIVITKNLVNVVIIVAEGVSAIVATSSKLLN